MAFVAVEVVHGAGVPGLVGLIHQVARGAEPWVVLSVIIDEIRWNGQNDEGGSEYFLIPTDELFNFQPSHPT